MLASNYSTLIAITLSNSAVELVKTILSKNTSNSLLGTLLLELCSSKLEGGTLEERENTLFQLVTCNINLAYCIIV